MPLVLIFHPLCAIPLLTALVGSFAAVSISPPSPLHGLPSSRRRRTKGAGRGSRGRAAPRPRRQREGEQGLAAAGLRAPGEMGRCGSPAPRPPDAAVPSPDRRAQGREGGSRGPGAEREAPLDSAACSRAPPAAAMAAAARGPPRRRRAGARGPGREPPRHRPLAVPLRPPRHRPLAAPPAR